MASYQTSSTAGPSRPTYPRFPVPSPSPITEQEPWHNSGANGQQYPMAMAMPQPRTVSDPASANVSRSASAASGHGDGAEGSKRNPLVDLIDSERVYVEQLGLIIRKVAAAWSRKDFPPPKLDAMFRCVEAVYRANRAFGTKLKEIGPNPSSPKALGDLLMRWIDDLEPAYHKYSTNFLTGFDSYQPVTRNQLLNGILQEISVASTPTPPLTQWSLDALFILPYTRLRYYKKLYSRLLRSTKEGRSDHKLLMVANERLEDLVNIVESRLEADVSENDNDETSQENRLSGNTGGGGANSREQSWSEKERISRTSSAMSSSMDSHTNRIEDRNSGGSAVTNMTSMTQSPQRRPQIQVSTNPVSSGSTPTSATTPLSDLELRIESERTIDLFSMTPKKCKLQMNPPSLPFTRSLRSSHDVTVYFTPNSTGQQVIHRRAHIFILSDLFLVAEWMEASEKAAKAQQVAREQPDRVGHGGPMPEMWLSYPPLAGKHLMVAEGQQANVLTVMIMKKETFVIHAESDIARDQIMKDLIECIDFASGVTRPSTAAPSPIYPDPRSPSIASTENRSNESAFPRYPSPFSNSSSPATSPRPGDQSEGPPMPLGGNALVSQMSQISLQPGEAIAWPRGPTPPQAMPPPQGIPPYNNQASSGAPTMAVLPPRGASLRPRVQSNNMQSPPQQHAPQIPPMPGMGYDQMPGGAPLPRSPSGRSVQSAPRLNMNGDLPPVPSIRPSGSHMSDQGHPGMPAAPFAQNPNHLIARSRSLEPLRAPEPPSARFSSFENLNGPSIPGGMGVGRSSPLTGEPEDEGDEIDEEEQNDTEEQEITSLTGPTVISAQMKCKIFLKQEHQKWKSLGSGKLKLYVQKTGPPLKQLVVENDSSKSQIIISTIILTDGVERVAKTGVAIEISDRGKRTGIVYMIQLRNEKSAMGLFESLLQGSDRAVVR
ncbi:hypothetical protein I302_100688 [Kwoniella bestiolae CBS 10118]|uniref:DH domain-containing protein n=1 Tax=Kwoniella bestiolae CBS 10118 TaxID=1296100 RepID=A0A1B9G5V5_9TREE|nr:hypothetical protein I302_04064 [Kwoniella bestiolae CBS 10118]OCF26381.1 hypothetical protein I302_04064 [Kwoniella bestiolae CBS 10118]